MWYDRYLTKLHMHREVMQTIQNGVTDRTAVFSACFASIIQLSPEDRLLDYARIMTRRTQTK